MILDYKYDQRQRKFCVSYINEQGSKSLMEFNVNRFKTYYYTPTGRFMSDTGAMCDVRWTEKPHKFDIKTYLTELDDKYKEKLNQKVFPKLYTFDIETEFIPGVQPEPSQAALPITTMQITSPNLNTIIFGTKTMSEEEQKKIEGKIHEYLDTVEFYKNMNVPKPSFKYIHFDTEEEMLKYFLSNIVSKVSVLAGWNSILFDWNYICNRVKNYYPSLSISMASCKHTTSIRRYVDLKNNTINLPMPDHTLILDMKQVIEENDKAVMPIKESMSLDYVARESIGAHKVEYEGSLQDLYKNDFSKYVYYGAMDSILVQMIDRRFKVMNNIYLYSLYCNEKIENCFSKVKTTEALVFKDFYERNIYIVPEDRGEIDRERLVGAYVKIPMKGLHQYVCCNDFASLYPSTIITCNLSFENWVGAFYDTEKLKEFSDRSKYIVVCATVYKNIGTYAKPKLGRQLGIYVDEEKLKKYRDDPNYFVSLNGHVYKNDKDYSFRRIESALKANRNISKYLSKKLDATIKLDVHDLLKGITPKKRVYEDDCVEAMKKIGYDITCSDSFNGWSKEKLTDFQQKLEFEITYYVSNEQAMKLLGNSMYGGCSHISFYWYNMGLANDVTSESKNLTHTMENHIPKFWRENWLKMKDLHKQLGIEVDEDKAMKLLEKVPFVTEEQDPDACHVKSWVYAAYGDTDSCFSTTKIRTEDGVKTIAELFDENYNTADKVTITPNGSELVPIKQKILNYGENNKLEYQSANYIMRHKVTKPKWKLRTKTGKEVIVTEDHSLIVFRDGVKLEVKPKDVLKTDKVLIIK